MLLPLTTDSTDRTDYALWRIEEIKRRVVSLRLTPLQPEAYAQPHKRASLSDHPHPSGLPTGRQEKPQNKIAAEGSTK